MESRCCCRLAIAAGWMTAPVHGQSGTTNGEWRTYGGDLGSTRYAPLDQINAGNFSKLQVAWRFKTDILGTRPDFNLQTTPLMINGVLYATAGSSRDAVAIDAATGELLWMYRLDEGKRAAASPRPLSGRGVAYWTDGQGDERIFFVTIGYQLVALDAKTGHPVRAFGQNGIVDLKQNNDQVLDPITGEIGLNSAPVVAKDVVIVGAAHRAGNAPRSKTNAKGYVRGFDVRPASGCGSSTPFRSRASSATRPGRTTRGRTRATPACGRRSRSTKSSASSTCRSSCRPATTTAATGRATTCSPNRWSPSICRPASAIWHFQFVHHGIWDYDIPCAPILADITVDGKPDQGDRAADQAGLPLRLRSPDRAAVWPIEERPVEQSTVPGEKTSPTQPFPDQAAAVRASGRSGRTI